MTPCGGVGTVPDRAPPPPRGPAARARLRRVRLLLSGGRLEPELALRPDARDRRAGARSPSTPSRRTPATRPSVTGTGSRTRRPGCPCWPCPPTRSSTPSGRARWSRARTSPPSSRSPCPRPWPRCSSSPSDARSASPPPGRPRSPSPTRWARWRFPYSTIFYGHQLSAALGLVAFSLVWRRRAPALAGLLLGLAVAVDYTSVILVVAVMGLCAGQARAARHALADRGRPPRRPRPRRLPRGRLRPSAGAALRVRAAGAPAAWAGSWGSRRRIRA